jgi:hypothetical protein
MLLVYLYGLGDAPPPTFIPGGDVSGVWVASGSPYLILGEITVPAVDTLIIEPGVEVNFQGHYKLIVNGVLEAAGTETDSILFTAADTSEGWHGIRFVDASNNSYLSYSIIEHGHTSGNGGGIYCYNSNLTISYCTITANEGYFGGGIFCSGGHIMISYCYVTGNAASSG